MNQDSGEQKIANVFQNWFKQPSTLDVVPNLTQNIYYLTPVQRTHQIFKNLWFRFLKLRDTKTFNGIINNK